MAARQIIHNSSDASKLNASQVQAEGFTAALQDSGLLSQEQRDGLMELVTLIPFAASHLARVVDAISECTEMPKRKLGMILHPMIIHMFTQMEWNKMLDEASTAADVLEVILLRVFLLGGVNLNEHTSKYMTSMWLFLQGKKCNDRI